MKKYPFLLLICLFIGINSLHAGIFTKKDKKADTTQVKKQKIADISEINPVQMDQAADSIRAKAKADLENDQTELERIKDQENAKGNKYLGYILGLFAALFGMSKKYGWLIKLLGKSKYPILQRLSHPTNGFHHKAIYILSIITLILETAAQKNIYEPWTLYLHGASLITGGLAAYAISTVDQSELIGQKPEANAPDQPEPEAAIPA